MLLSEALDTSVSAQSEYDFMLKAVLKWRLGTSNRYLLDVIMEYEQFKQICTYKLGSGGLQKTEFLHAAGYCVVSR